MTVSSVNQKEVHFVNIPPPPFQKKDVESMILQLHSTPFPIRSPNNEQPYLKQGNK